jgi:hypothetical protein
VATAGHVIDPAAAGLTGYTGWIVMAALIAILVIARRFPTPRAASLRANWGKTPRALAPAD